MWKRMIALMVAVIVVVGMQAQDRKKSEFETRIGMTLPTASIIEVMSCVGPQLALEWRRNLTSVPMDVGGELYIGVAARKLGEWECSARTAALSLVSHYHFCQAKRFYAFAGMGIGYGLLDPLNSEPGDSQCAVVFSPRVGFEVLNHLRLAYDMRLSRERYTTVGFTIGYVW